MDKIPDTITIDPKFGTVVNDKPVTTDEWVEKADNLTLPVACTVKLKPEQIIRLDRLASDSSLSRDDYIQSIVGNHVDENVGKATIKGPSFAKGRKITGPSSRKFNAN
jgi:hypothetical protein